MLARRFYYQLKPYLPWRVRMALRRISAKRKYPHIGDIWPVHPGAARPPASWPGWPEGKKFAFVLTHDVEGPEGLEKCRRLMEVEQQAGFRSCFNLIPRGSYSAPAELRAELLRNGFEVGVHDLKHDGKLFNSRPDFEKNALKISRYLRDWGAAGFRSGFMLCNLDWLHSVDLCYDSSTFDTDPFEPQSGGPCTIFPHWVSHSPEAAGSERDLPTPGAPGGTARSRGGYMELPYTLPQDSTLFLLLGEKTPEIWFRKLDWIAAHRGMALVNVHPDYVRFEGERASPRTYPVAHYRALLDYVRHRYGDSFWQPLPRDVARYAQAFKPENPPAPRRVCMVTHSFYESDNRVTRYAEALADRGDEVDVLALRRSPDLPREEKIGRVKVHRIQDRFGKTERSAFSYFWPWLRFLAASSWWSGLRHWRRPYDLFHIHNIPDFLVLAAWYPKLTGARVILDIHDIVPEFYSSKFDAGTHSATTSVLKWLERRSARLADHVIISNHLWFDKYTARTGTAERCSVFINNVDNHVFRPFPHTSRDGRALILFPGGLQWHQGLDIALKAFRRINREFPHAEFHIYGDGSMKPALVNLAAELGLEGKVRFFDPVRINEIARVMANADVGVVPKRADSFGDEAYSTKIMEFMAVGVPVVVSNTKIDRFYFNESVVRFFESGNEEALADAVIELLRNGALREKMKANAIVYAARNSWDAHRTRYLGLVNDVIRGAPTPASCRLSPPDTDPLEAGSAAALAK